MHISSSLWGCGSEASHLTSHISPATYSMLNITLEWYKFLLLIMQCDIQRHTKPTVWLNKLKLIL